MPGKSQTPALRFAGFTGEWEERKLCDCVRIRTGFPFASKDFSEDGEYLVITNGNIKDEFDDVDGTIGNRISISDEGLCREYELNDSDILVTMDGNVGRSAKVVSSKQILAQRVGRLTASENRDFFYQTLNTGAFCSAMALLAHGGTIKHISLSEIGAYRFLSPRYSLEQAAIGRFFRKVDSLITQQQKKVEKLQGLKKGLMKKMFPRGGRTLPEVRFAGFDEEWVERKFQDIFLYERPENYIVKSNKYSDDFTMPVLTANKSFILGYTDEKSPYTAESLIFDDFTLECRYVDFPYMLKSSAIKILTLKDNKRDSLFFSYCLLNNAEIENMGHARHYISVVQPTKIRTTSFDEQTAIGRVFRRLDDLITLHGQKLEKLRHVKQALLGKMFV